MSGNWIEGPYGAYPSMGGYHWLPNTGSHSVREGAFDNPRPIWIPRPRVGSRISDAGGASNSGNISLPTISEEIVDVDVVTDVVAAAAAVVNAADVVARVGLRQTCRFYRWLRRDAYDASEIRARTAAFGNYFDIADDVPHQTHAPNVAYTHRVAHLVRAKMGIPKPTLANREVARQIAVRYMVEHGHRPAHVTRDVEPILTLVFTPTKHEVREARLYNNYAAKGPRAKYREYLGNVDVD